ncbi:hypothetical protein SAMN04488550_1169 [Gordonia malaquae]|uniref:Uncharacterized protein n=1 Tax=Gordonia malaquae NBRC 108250 TaxID=1223542 RepID=M3VGR6_GORML|nr:hypothetical protein [Gordonia malaquae]GAC81149.1 hypothetical protein GM1_029_00520 [Gordonia malaquae NBRC 108250]SEC01690.1 hypothetical protein SAMN04488550_1169 [Gordonia malaquae]
MSNDELIDVAGRCADFCEGAICGDHGATDTPLAEHGEFCTGTSRAGVGRGPNYERVEVWLSAAMPYRVGPTTRSAMIRDRETRGNAEGFVGVYVEHGNASSGIPDVLLTAGEARQLAAALLWIADGLDSLDRPHPSIRRQK